MKRHIESHLLAWRTQAQRKPIILRGARQVGKTHVVRSLGNSFEHFIEINFEMTPKLADVFIEDLDPQRIIRDLSLALGTKITPGETLLFFDEIQMAPPAITALRYFYEKMPELHVIAAGSLLDFALEGLGVPVGRVQFLYMYPLSFLEFLQAKQLDCLVEAITQHDVNQPMSQIVHDKLLTLLGEYFAVGGMPEALQCWLDTEDLFACQKIHTTLINNYQQDFEKYATKFQIKYVDTLFQKIPRQLGEIFKYSKVSDDYRKRELVPCLDLLTKASVCHPIYHSDGQGIPLGAQTKLDKFKLIFLDIALSQTILGLSTNHWILSPRESLINNGAITESFVGQEMLAYSHCHDKKQLYFWIRQERSSQAEVDYLIQKDRDIIPIEVKSGKAGKLRSLHLFLEGHGGSPYGIKISAQNYMQNNKIVSYPLYAINEALKES